MQPGVALGFGVPRSRQTTVTSSGFVGLTEILPHGSPADLVAPDVCRPMTENGMSAAAVFELDRRDRRRRTSTPPSVDFTTMNWLSRVVRDLPGGLVLFVEEMHIERAVGSDLGDRELVLVALGAARRSPGTCSSDGSPRSPGRRPGEAAVVRIAQPDRRLRVAPVEAVQEARRRHVRAAVVRRARVVVDGDPFLVVEDAPDWPGRCRRPCP